jgi:hypothetical protein
MRTHVTFSRSFNVESLYMSNTPKFVYPPDIKVQKVVKYNLRDLKRLSTSSGDLPVLSIQRLLLATYFVYRLCSDQNALRAVQRF